MYVIEIVIKSTPMPMSVQRKTVEDAKSVYQQVLSALRSGGNSLLELTCERQPEKQIAVMTGEVVAVQMYEKSGTASSGKTPGFVAALTES
jgi:hypothetical protein